MGSGSAIRIGFFAPILFSLAVRTAAEGIWVINIDNTPAPSPEDGPPLSYNAVRDKAQLPYEIVGVIGAYVAFVFLTSTLLLTLGRRLRQQARRMIDRDPNDTEMRKPVANATGPSNLAHRFGVVSKKSSKSSMVTVVPVAGTGSFDHGVIARDRSNLQAGLADIYGAVYAAEENRPSPNPMSYRPLTHQPQGSVTNFSKPMSPTVSHYPYSIDAHGRQSSDAMSIERLNLPAHAASQQYARVEDDDIEETLPPQYYFGNTSPELPPTQMPEIHGMPPTQPANAFDWNQPYRSPAEPPRAWPQPNPQRSSTMPMMSPLQEGEVYVTSPTETFRELRSARSVGNVHNPLPLRSKTSQTLRSSRVDELRASAGGRPLPSPGILSPGLLSPTPIVQRTLDMPDNMFLKSFPTGLRTPLTGSLMSMQSQFKQYNHAETRAERKQREREERQVHGAFAEDLVEADEDMWASNY